MKRIITVLMLGILAISLAGCGKKSVDYDPDNFLINGTEDNPYQIVKETITLDIFVPRGSFNPSFSELTMFKNLEEITNLNLNFIEADTSTYTELKSAQWEDKNNLPDIFLFNNTLSEQVIYSEFGALVPFNDSDLVVNGLNIGNLIENYMPNYSSLLDSNFNVSLDKENAKEIATLDNGLMYSTLSVNDVPRDLTYKMFINQQWIDNLNTRYDLGLPNADKINTIEEYLAVLRAFKQYDANQNGDPDDEIPVSALELKYLREFIMASYGYVSRGIEISDDESEFVYTPGTEVYKKYLETMNTMYSEGLLDNGVFTIKTDQQLAAKGRNYRLGSYCSAAAYITVGYEYEDEYKTFGPLTSDYYQGEPLHLGYSHFIPSGAIIPTGTPYVREIARFLDIMYSEYGTQLISYGVEGEDFTWDDEEKTSWTFIVPEDWDDTQEAYRATITPNVGTASALYWSYDFVGKMNDEIIRGVNEMSEIYMPYLKVAIPEKIRIDKDKYNEVVLYNTSLEVFLNTVEYDFITGNKNFEDDWDNLQNELIRYNADKLLKIYNDALNDYKNGN